MNFEAELNAEQLEVARHVEGPALVLAGAGSGKTRCATYRIVHLIKTGVPAHSILGLTFTNKAAKEMKHRIETLAHQHVLISTFHSLGARILRESIHHLGYNQKFTIYDEDDSIKLLKACMTDLDLTDARFDAKVFKGMISNSKNALTNPESCKVDASSKEIEKAFVKLYALYQVKLLEYNALDFDDLLYLIVKLFREHPDVLEFYQNRWQFLLIDEYQDTNAAQYEMVRLLVGKSHNIFAVGDPDQSIYSWRGANIRNIMDFERDFPGAKVFRLEQNYRSRSNILEAANELITHNYNRYEKKLWSDRGEGDLIKHFIGEDERDEAQFVAERIRFHHEVQGVSLNQIAVFYRTNSQSRPFEDQLLNRRIPYVIIGGVSFYQRREIKDILAFLRVVESEADYISFARTINLPKRGIGEVTLDKIREGATEEGLPVISFVEAVVKGHPLKTPIKFSPKQKEGLNSYMSVINQLREISKGGSLEDLVRTAINESGYMDYLKLDAETFDDRKENLSQFLGKAMEWDEFAEEPTLSSFLEEVSLKSNLDELKEEHDRISLMTLHNGKGLEFEVVFVVGLEEDLLPHVNTKLKGEDIEEERRLLYVGMTRAKEHLYLCHALSRRMWGQFRTQKESRFLKEVPSQYLQKIKMVTNYQPKRRARDESAFIDDADQSFVEEEEAGQFTQGDKVFHSKFGIGVVKGSSKGSMGLMYKVYFMNDKETKDLVAKYANLKLL